MAVQPRWRWDLPGRAARPRAGRMLSAAKVQVRTAWRESHSGPTAHGTCPCRAVLSRQRRRRGNAAPCRIGYNRGREAPRSALVCWPGPAETSCSCLKQTGPRPCPLWPAGRPDTQADPPSPFSHTEVTVLSFYRWEKPKYPYLRTLAYAFNDSSESEKTTALLFRWLMLSVLWYWALSGERGWWELGLGAGGGTRVW